VLLGFSVVDFPVFEEKVARWKACRSISAIRQELHHPSDQTVMRDAVARGECAGIIRAGQRESWYHYAGTAKTTSPAPMAGTARASKRTRWLRRHEVC
jgi:hypothetical protein